MGQPLPDPTAMAANFQPDSQALAIRSNMFVAQTDFPTVQ
jgi:hypothetical protein